jgi:hypothetical protein
MELFQQYEAELRWAINEARSRRKTEIASLTGFFEGNEARARESVARKGPLCIEPHVIGVIRKYWLACDRLNESVSPRDRVDPLVFINDRLQAHAPDLAQVLSEIPYWPMGQDEEGRWV